MEKDDAKDKALFAVGLMAAFLTFSSYKEELSKIHLKIGQTAPTLSSLFLVFIIALSLSAYFYALSYLKYSYPRFQNLFVFKIFTFLANFLYSFGLSFPLLIFVLWIAPVMPIIPPKLVSAMAIFDIFGIAAVVIFSVTNAISKQKNLKKLEIENIDRNKAISLQRALSLFNGKFYNESVIESFRLLEIFLREILLKKLSIYTEGISPSRIIHTATKNKILDGDLAKKIDELRKMRNFAVHGNKSLSRREAEKALKIVKLVLEIGGQ